MIVDTWNSSPLRSNLLRLQCTCCTVQTTSKVFSCPNCIFEIHQLWQSGFSRMYSNCCCSGSIEPELLNIGQSSHKVYSNNILNFQESRPILNAWTKKVWKLIEFTTYTHIYILSKFGDCSRRQPEGSHFNSYYTKVYEKALLLDCSTLPLIRTCVLSVKQRGIEYHFLSLWYDSTWDWTRSPGPLANTLPMSRFIYIYIVSLKQAFSLYHNHSMRLDTRDSSKSNLNPHNFTADR